MSSILLVNNLKKYFPVGRAFFSNEEKFVHAVDDISFKLNKGEILALVGESGCGKTTVGKLILRLIEPTSGSISFEEKNIFQFNGKEVKYYTRNVQIIFQDPQSSLNPRKTIFQTLSKPFLIHNLAKKQELRDKIIGLLDTVGLTPGLKFINRYPHEFSGGQRQRICIARAISLNPKLIIADEPVSSLDVSIRAQILTLMSELHRRFDMTFLFITHDLPTARFFSTKVAVMYLGKIMELCESKELFNNPIHPYTRALLSSRPIPDPKLTRSIKRFPLSGEITSAINLPKGCRYYDRCPKKSDRCIKSEAELLEIEKGHFVSCYQS